MLKINNLFFLPRIQFISDVTDLHCLHKSSLLAPDLIPEAKGERLFLTAKRTLQQHVWRMQGSKAFLGQGKSLG